MHFLECEIYLFVDDFRFCYSIITLQIDCTLRAPFVVVVLQVELCQCKPKRMEGIKGV